MTTKNDIILKNRGFSFLELIIVIAIIGILAAMAVPNFHCIRYSSSYYHRRDCYRTASMIKEAVESYNKYHPAMKELDLERLIDENYLDTYSLSCKSSASNSYYLIHTSPNFNDKVYVGCTEHGLPESEEAIKANLKFKLIEDQEKSYKNSLLQKRLHNILPISLIFAGFSVLFFILTYSVKSTPKVKNHTEKMEAQ